MAPVYIGAFGTTTKGEVRLLPYNAMNFSSAAVGDIFVVSTTEIEACKVLKIDIGPFSNYLPQGDGTTYPLIWTRWDIEMKNMGNINASISAKGLGDINISKTIVMNA